MQSIFKDDNIYEQLKLEAFAWIGTPYRHFMAEKGVGADCALFIQEIFITLNIVKHVEYPYQDRFWFMFKSKEMLLEQINTNFKYSLCPGLLLEEVSNFERGDLLTFAIKSALTNHVSLLLEGDNILHSIQRRGVIVQPYTQEYQDALTYHYRIIKV